MNQQVNIEIEGVEITCDCYVEYDPPNYFDGYPGHFQCDVEGIQIGDVDVTDLIVNHAPNLSDKIEEAAANKVKK